MYDRDISVLNYHPVLSGITNVLALFGLLYYILLKGWQKNSMFNKAIVMTAVLWLLNAVFVIGTAAATLRTQSFSLIMTTCLAVLLVDWLFQLIRNIKLEESKKQKVREQLPNRAIA